MEENKDIEKLKKYAETQIKQAKMATEKLNKTLFLSSMEEEDSMVKVEIYSEGGSEYLPKYATEGSSGMDLRAYIPEEVTLQPFERKLIPTGIYLNLPKNYEAQIRARSGTAFKRGLTLINGIATIDEDYTGELFIAMVNLDTEPQTIKPKERIAQLIISPVSKCVWEEQDTPEEFNSGNREGGFGSTGNF